MLEINARKRRGEQDERGMVGWKAELREFSISHLSGLNMLPLLLGHPLQQTHGSCGMAGQVLSGNRRAHASNPPTCWLGMVRSAKYNTHAKVFDQVTRMSFDKFRRCSSIPVFL